MKDKGIKFAALTKKSCDRLFPIKKTEKSSDSFLRKHQMKRTMAVTTRKKSTMLGLYNLRKEYETSIAKSGQLQKAHMDRQIAKPKLAIVGMIAYAFMYRTALLVKYPRDISGFDDGLTFYELIEHADRAKVVRLKSCFKGNSIKAMHESIQCVRRVGFDGFFSTKMICSDDKYREPTSGEVNTFIAELRETRRLCKAEYEGAICLLNALIEINTFPTVKKVVGDTLLAVKPLARA